MKQTGAKFAVSVRVAAGARVVTPQGELDLVHADEFAKTLLADADSKVVVDLSELRSMDSSGLAALILAKKRLTEGGRDLVMTRPNQIVQRVLETVGLDHWIGEWSPNWDVPGRRGRGVVA